MLRNIFICMAVLVTGAFAQGPPPGRGPGSRGGPGARFLGAEPGMPGRVVKNAPYSADIVTESTQSLPDGNHIRQSTTSHVFRDSDGRTRQEQSLGSLSALANSTSLPSVVFIHDPVAGASYALNSRDKTATKTMIRPRGNHMQGRGATSQDPTTGGQTSGNSARAQMAPRGRGPFGGRMANSNNFKTESLARQNIEGVPADGTRTTFTIPAGQIGNEQPIQVVDERWYSPDLQTFVMIKHSDPRNGETVTRLTNISRSEPSHTLFEVPADFKVTEGRMHPAGPPQQQ